MWCRWAIADGWTHQPFAADIADGLIYGRGATDMKGSVAAFAARAIDFVQGSGQVQGLDLVPHHRRRGRPRHQRHGQGAAMDEGQRPHSRPLPGRRAELRGQAGRHDQDRPARLLSFTVTVDGNQGHAAYPHKADNPDAKLARFIDRIAFAQAR